MMRVVEEFNPQLYEENGLHAYRSKMKGYVNSDAKFWVKVSRVNCLFLFLNNLLSNNYLIQELSVNVE